MSRRIGASTFSGIIGTDAVQSIATTRNAGSDINVTPFSFVPPRGLFQVIIQDLGTATVGEGTVSYYVKGGLSKNIGDTTADYNITQFPTTNIDTTAPTFSTGPNTLVVDNASIAAQYTMILNSLTNTATLSQSVGAPAGEVIVTFVSFRSK